jgi:hypothetical protein
MSRWLRRISCGIVFLVHAAAVAGAAPLIDPLIGVRGTDGNSQSVFDPTPQAFGACPAHVSGPPLPADYLCAPYNAEGLAILSLDLRFFDDVMQPFPVAALTLDVVNSDFTLMQPLDGDTVRLSDPFGLPTRCDALPGAACPGFVIFTAAAGPGDVPASFVSVVSFTGVAQVPEPALLALLAAGLLGAAGRRARGLTRPTRRGDEAVR